jgi:sulfur-carrier protein
LQVAPEGNLRGGLSLCTSVLLCFRAVSAGAALAVTFSMPSTATSTLTVRLLLFASYAEALGLDAIEFTLDEGATVADAIGRLRTLPGGERLPPKPLCAVNLSQASPDTRLRADDELAVLPPLAGG